MIEAFTSFLNNYKSKIRNPLMGTIFSVWIIHNWQIIYALFNFDKDYTMQQKINFIQDYFLKKIFWCEFFRIVGFAFLAIIITFALLGLSRFLTDLYYKRVETWIKVKVSKHEIFTVDKKVELELEITGLKEKIEKLKDLNSRSDTLNTFLQNRNIDLETKYNNELVKFSEESIKALDKYELLEKNNIHSNKVINYWEGLIKLLSKEENEQLKDLYNNKIVSNSGKKRTMEFQNKMLEWGFLVNNNGGNYVLTQSGIFFLEYYNS